MKQINSAKCTKELQYLILFATEMVFIQKAVSDLHWKNIARTKHKTEIFEDSAKLLGTPLHTWYYIYRHLLMTQDTKAIFVFPK